MSAAAFPTGQVAALRSVGFTTGTPVVLAEVVRMPAVVDRTGLTAAPRLSAERVQIVVACRRRLLDGLRQAARELGATGVVGVHLASESVEHLAPSSVVGTAHQLSVAGVPVYAAGHRPPEHVFLTTIDAPGALWFTTCRVRR